MLVIRPILTSDYQALNVCAQESGYGFTSLPVDEALLKSRIKHSIASFAENARFPGHQSYLMVAEETETGEIAGVTGIKAAVGLTTPFYTYHITKQVRHSVKLDIYNRADILVLGNNYTGATEICTLFLREKFREGYNGKLLSKCRFLMLAQFKEKFADVVFAEMRGVSDQDGQSPFWQWLKAHFFGIDFTSADHLTGIGDKSFIAELMPQLPIYINLLSDEVRAVIGKVHKNTKPALRLLEKEGFRSRSHIDIFDGGPIVESLRENIRSVKNSMLLDVDIGEHIKGKHYLVANTDFQHYRATVARIAVEPTQQTAMISQDVAQALGVTAKDKVRIVAIN